MLGFPGVCEKTARRENLRNGGAQNLNICLHKQKIWNQRPRFQHVAATPQHLRKKPFVTNSLKDWFFRTKNYALMLWTNILIFYRSCERWFLDRASPNRDHTLDPRSFVCQSSRIDMWCVVFFHILVSYGTHRVQRQLYSMWPKLAPNRSWMCPKPSVPNIANTFCCMFTMGSSINIRLVRLRCRWQFIALKPESS